MTKVFISHGHDELTRHKLKGFLRDRLQMEPVVLSEQPDLGLTIVEELEHYGPGCQFAVIVLTADDTTADGGTRARQNVIHEIGYFHGLLGRERVLLLKESGVELFSNISGLVYKEFRAGAVESVFEEIRQAIESGNASEHASSVPRMEKADQNKEVQGLLDQFHEITQSMAGHYKTTMWDKIRSVPASLPPRVRVGRIQRMLETEKDRWTTRIRENKAAIENTGGKPGEVLAMAMRMEQLAEIEDIETAFADCLNILATWQTSGEPESDWLEKAISEIEDRLTESNQPTD